MTHDEALGRLRALENSGDTATAHEEADEILLTLLSQVERAFFGDEQIAEAFRAIPKWYA
jgi:hypothetical protein